MKTTTTLRAAAILLAAAVPPAQAAIDGLTGPNFTLTAKRDYITTPDGGSLTIWGYSSGGRAQYPGPTLIVNQGDTVTVTLTSEIGVNDTPLPVSLVFPGQSGVHASGGSKGLLTHESAAADQTVTYTFTAGEPGTYIYHSGTRPDLQVEMGLFGALVVRPERGANYAYNHPDTRFDQEYLFLLSEMDPDIHAAVDRGTLAAVDTTAFFSRYWFINGRAAPDSLLPDHVPWLPTQPYGALATTHPGDTVLMRVTAAGREPHPFHHHGNHALVIARDGRLLESAPGQGPDLAYADFTITAAPGETYDALFRWTGKGLGWDIRGDAASHTCTDNDGDRFDDTTWEFCPDHGKRFPVQLPEQQNLTVGAFWSGSPYMGALGQLPPGEGGLNPNGGFFFMWHSHTEKELTNFDIFPGGLMTMLVVEPRVAAQP